MLASQLRSTTTAAIRPWGTVRDDSDESLMLRYIQGEVRAFEVLVQRYRRPIFNFVLRSTHDRAAAEDVTQECFLRVVRAADSFDRGSKFTPWLYTIARNLCVDLSRRMKLRRAQSLDEEIGEDGKATRLDRVLSKELPTDHDTAHNELELRMRRAVNRLPDEQREIFLLREFADLQWPEIAQIVGVPEGTVKSRMRYALEKLREMLAEYSDAAAEVAK